MSQIREYQFVQSEPDRITLNVVASPRLDAAAENALQQRIHREVDAGMTLEVNHVDAIRRAASGKRRFVICELD